MAYPPYALRHKASPDLGTMLISSSYFTASLYWKVFGRADVLPLPQGNESCPHPALGVVSKLWLRELAPHRLPRARPRTRGVNLTISGRWLCSGKRRHGQLSRPLGNKVPELWVTRIKEVFFPSCQKTGCECWQRAVGLNDCIPVSFEKRWNILSRRWRAHGDKVQHF